MKIAFLSLISDVGHVVPLLKIANIFQSKVYDVLYIGPQETQDLAASMGVPFVDIGCVRPLNSSHCLKVISAKSNMWRYMLYGAWFDLHYMEASVLNGHQKQDALLRETKKFNPDILVVDDHFFLEIFCNIASELKKPLIINNSEGSFHKEVAKMPFEKNLRYYYYTCMKHILETGYFSLKWLYSPVKMVKRRRSKDLLARARNFCIESALDKKICIREIFPGISYLEELYLSEKISKCSQTKAMGPLPIIKADKLENAIFEWLDVSSDVIYVSFGSMIQVDAGLKKNILTAVAELNFRILWAAPVCPDEVLFSTDTQKYKWVKWVSQTDVLDHANVKIFISHGGAGALQEAIWFGVPMVIFPHIWDQFYNARRAEELGVAINLNRKKTSSKRIELAIQDVIALTEPAKKLSHVFKEAECSEKVVAISKECVGFSNNADKHLLNMGL